MVWKVPISRNGVSIDKEICWGSVCVKQDGGERWADPTDVVESCLSVEGVEGVTCINQQHSLILVQSEGRPYGMHGSLDPRDLPSTQLDVWVNGAENSLGNDTPGSVSYVDRTNAGMFI